MKHLLYPALLTIFLAGIFACNSPAPKPPKIQSKALSSGTPDPGVFMNPGNANIAKHKWQALRPIFVNALKGMDAPQDTIYVAKGFHIPLDDLRDILNNIGDDSQLYAMLGIQYDSTKTPPAPYISLIFQAPDTTARRTIQYYDFTRPCPSDCPSVNLK